MNLRFAYVILIPLFFLGTLDAQEEVAWNSNVYRTSSLLMEGGYEFKLFNNIYTQTSYAGTSELLTRDTYFSAFMQMLYGYNDKLDIGLDLVYKSNVLQDQADSSPLNSLRFDRSSVARINSSGDSIRDGYNKALITKSDAGLSHIGPKVKFNPIKKFPNLTIQQTVYIPIQQTLDPTTVSFTQLFYDKPLGPKSQLFIELSSWTRINETVEPDVFFKVFGSYFPNRKFTIYGMVNIPREVGAGVKYYIVPNFEVEFLYTYFLPIEKFVGFTHPSTLNFGIRYTRRNS